MPKSTSSSGGFYGIATFVKMNIAYRPLLSDIPRFVYKKEAKYAIFCPKIRPGDPPKRLFQWEHRPNFSFKALSGMLLNRAYMELRARSCCSAPKRALELRARSFLSMLSMNSRFGGSPGRFLGPNMAYFASFLYTNHGMSLRRGLYAMFTFPNVAMP